MRLLLNSFMGVPRDEAHVFTDYLATIPLLVIVSFALGMAETVHAANRGEKITVIFVNNAIYGMTGGQMAPTTLAGQRTSTTPYGRDVHHDGFPMRICELLAALEGPVYLERCADRKSTCLNSSHRT